MSRNKFSNVPLSQSGSVTLVAGGVGTVSNVYLDTNSRIILTLQNAVAAAQESASDIVATGSGNGVFNVSSSAGALAEGAIINWWIVTPGGNPAQ